MCIHVKQFDEKSILRHGLKEHLIVIHLPTRRCWADPCSFVIQFNEITPDHSILFHFSHVYVWTIQAFGTGIVSI